VKSYALVIGIRDAGAVLCGPSLAPKLVVRRVSKMRRLNAFFKSGFIRNLQVDFFFFFFYPFPFANKCESILGVLGNRFKSRIQ
jgi:hypothetical protein